MRQRSKSAPLFRVPWAKNGPVEVDYQEGYQLMCDKIVIIGVTCITHMRTKPFGTFPYPPSGLRVRSKFPKKFWNLHCITEVTTHWAWWPRPPQTQLIDINWDMMIDSVARCLSVAERCGSRAWADWSTLSRMTTRRKKWGWWQAVWCNCFWK